MTTATLRISAPPSRGADCAASKGLLARLFDAMVEARMRQAMREHRARTAISIPEHLLKKRRLRGDRQRRRQAALHALSTSVTHSPSGMRRTSLSPCGR